MKIFFIGLYLVDNSHLLFECKPTKVNPLINFLVLYEFVFYFILFLKTH